MGLVNGFHILWVENSVNSIIIRRITEINYVTSPIAVFSSCSGKMFFSYIFFVYAYFNTEYTYGCIKLISYIPIYSHMLIMDINVYVCAEFGQVDI